MGMIINRRRVYGGKSLPQGAVDMGLPSGTLWAQGNIVKDAQGNYAIGEPTDYGCYFSWGNIDGYNYGDGYSFNADNYALTPGSQLTEDIPNNDILHDAAAARIDRGWHLPTKDNFIEVFNSTYTTRTWKKINGINGWFLTSKINGNTLFFSAVGTSGGLQQKNDYGCYWTSQLYSKQTAYSLGFISAIILSGDNNYRFAGYAIRPVHN